jgi:hypothetical protein
MSSKKKAALAAGATLGSLLLALLIIPLVFGDQIEARIRAEIERATTLQVDWADSGLTFFRNFPNPTFSLSGLTAVGSGRFTGDTLAAVGDLRLVLQGGSVLGAIRGTGALVVGSVRIEEPSLRLQVDEDGLESWDILVEREDPSRDASGRGVAISLQRLELTDGDFVLDNARTGVFASLGGVSHSLRGDFSREALVADTRSHADEVTLRFADVPYVSGVMADFDAAFEVDMAQQRVRLTENELRLNDLALRLDGEVAVEGENLAADLTFAAPSAEFAQLLSLVPLIYANDFESLETRGTFSFAGTIDGLYGPTAFPAFTLEAAVRDGSFRYPDLPLPAEAIVVDLSIKNPGGDVDSTVVELSAFHVEIGRQPVDAALTLRTPVSDPDADVRVEGSLDLAALSRTVKFDRSVGLTGVIQADAQARARRSDVDSARYDRITAGGTVTARDVTLRSAELRQPVDIQSATIRLTPEAGQLDDFQARLGSSDLSATGRLDNLLGFALGRETLQGMASFHSDRFILDEWRSEDELAVIAVPAMLDLTLDGTVGELIFNNISMTEVRGRATVREQRVTFQSVSLEALSGRVGIDGFYETLVDAAPAFALDLMLDSLDVAESSAAVTTLRTLAPIAAYTQGSFSSVMSLTGTLGENMAPVLEVLDGDGSLSTSSLAIEGLPILERLAERLQLQTLSHPTVGAVRSSVRIEDGRLIVDPFDVPVAGLSMSVSGSNGIDQSVDYTLGLQVPRAGFAEAALTNLASRAGPLGASLAAADPVRVGIQVTGTVRQPTISVSLSETTGAARDAAAQATRAAVDAQVDAARVRAEAEREQARQRARVQADSIIAEAGRRADTVRAEAAAAAARIRAEGDRAADETLARATNPIARAAAQPVADRIRREAAQRADDLEREADERATAMVAEAQARADALVGGTGSP